MFRMSGFGPERVIQALGMRCGAVMTDILHYS